MDFSLMKDFMDRLTDWRIPGNGISVCIDGKEVFSYNSGFAAGSTGFAPFRLSISVRVTTKKKYHKTESRRLRESFNLRLFILLSQNNHLCALQREGILSQLHSCVTKQDPSVHKDIRLHRFIL